MLQKTSHCFGLIIAFERQIHCTGIHYAVSPCSLLLGDQYSAPKDMILFRLVNFSAPTDIALFQLA